MPSERFLSPDTFISIDIETTGLDPGLHEIIEIGAVKVENGDIIDEFSELVKPQRPIPDAITHLTGIDNEEVENAGTIADVIPPLLRFLQGYRLLGHNVRFDVDFLRRAAGMGNIESAIDNIELARIVLPRLPSYSLDSLIDFFALTPEKRHRAFHDAKITAIIFLKLVDMLRLIPDDRFHDLYRISTNAGSTLEDIFDSQFRERTEGLRPKPAKGPGEIPVLQGTDNNIFGRVTESQDFLEPQTAVIDPDAIEELLKAGGKLSEHHRAYEERSGQILMSKRIALAFNESEILLVEAGTGIGKSIAYLVPAIFWAEAARERVIVSTNTKNLQEQLFTKDIPLMSEVLGFPFRAVILKGRGNYLCLNRWNSLVDNPGRFLSKEERSLLLPVAAWLQETKSGDLSETGFYHMLVESGLIDHINSESSSCRGARCSQRDQCFITRIRKAAQRSHVIIVNHSLVFSDMVSDGGVLGPYNRIIFDEAHNIEKVALRFLGIMFGYYRIRRILNRLLSTQDGSYGLLAVLGDWAEEMTKGWPEFAANGAVIESAAELVRYIREVTGDLFASLDAAVRAVVSRSSGGHTGKHRYVAGTDIFRQCEDRINGWSDAVVELVKRTGDLLNLISGISANHLRQKEDILIDLEEVQTDLIALSNDFAFLIEAGGKNVFWFEYPENESPYALTIHSAPLNIADKLATGLYDHMETVIMTSATLTVARDFTYIRERLGLNLDSRERTTDFIAASPFDYNRQAALVIPSFLPSPKQDLFIEESNDVIISLARDIRRGMLVLFTSWGHLLRAYNALKDEFARTGITLLAQGIDGSRSLLLRRFSEETTSVLFGTDSFWEGVDVPGNALEVVVISRLPFAVPSDPVIEAQMEEIERAGRDPFIDFSVPEAAIKLRQGAGRLIRHRNDRGVIIIMDKRVITTRYGSLFKRSLPGGTIRADSKDMLIEGVRRFFENSGKVAK